MDERQFDYEQAACDLYNAGCPFPEEIYSHRTEQGRAELLAEYNISPDRYYKKVERQDEKRPPEEDDPCYLTTACVKARGLSDSCDELRTMRAFRDEYAAKREGGRRDIGLYYKNAPGIVKRINVSDDPASIWKEIYDLLIAPSVELIKNGRNDEAYALYRDTTLELARRFPEEKEK